MTLIVPVIAEPLEQTVTPIEALENVLEILPPWIQEHVRDHLDQVEDIIMEVGRPLRFNLYHGFKRFAEIVSEDELKNLKFAFRDVAADNRTGIAGTLHRIAVRRRRARGGEGVIVGAIIRLARVTVGVAEPLRPYIDGSNLLLMGPPKSGKTTLLRDIVRIMAEQYGPRLVIVDTSNEIGGWSDVPHPIIGDAVRLMVPGPEFQEKVITEAIANWSAEKIVLDEIKRLNDALALEEGSKTGVGFSATVHARSLKEALERKAYAPLFGNVDLIACKKHTRVSFEKIIEIKARGEYVVYEDAEEAISKYLNGESIPEHTT